LSPVFNLGETIAAHADFLVADAVSPNRPVSRNSLLTGKRTGNLIKLAVTNRFDGLKSSLFADGCKQIPYAAEQGICRHEQGRRSPKTAKRRRRATIVEE
jgi:hypothetical protein